VFTVPKALRPYFRHDRTLFAEVSRLIFNMLRWNPYYHTIVLEGGFDHDGTFFYIPIGNLASMSEVFRRRLIALLLDRKLLDDQFACNLMSWKHCGFSIDNSVRLMDQETKASLSEYIASPPISLKKIRYEPNSAPSPKRSTAHSSLRSVLLADERSVAENALCERTVGEKPIWNLNRTHHPIR